MCLGDYAAVEPEPPRKISVSYTTSTAKHYNYCYSEYNNKKSRIVSSTIQSVQGTPNITHSPDILRHFCSSGNESRMAPSTLMSGSIHQLAHGPLEICSL